MSTRTTRFLAATAALTAGAAVTGCAEPDLGSDAQAVTSGQRLEALGAFSCDFALDLALATEPIGATIERDRILLQRAALAETAPDDPGMLQKHIPFTPTSPTAGFAGGRYLFQGRLQAAIYADLIERRFVYPAGVQFLDRPEFADPECRDWTVITAWRFAPLEAHTAMRTERFDTGRATVIGEALLAARLAAQAPALVAEAQARGHAEVQLLHSLRDHKVQVVYVASRVLPPSPDAPDGAAFGQLASAPPLADDLAAATHLTRVFDRTAFVLNVWRPYAAGDHGAAALWPSSPPIPGPFCGDGVCVPSSGETGATCAADCTATCGDALCQPPETLDDCPSDCALPFVP